MPRPLNTLANRCLMSSVGKLSIHLQFLGDRGVPNAHYYSVSEHFFFQRAVLTTLDQAIERGDVLFCCFTIELVSLIKTSPLEYHVFSDIEVFVELFQDFGVFLPILVGDACRGKNVVGLVAQAIK